MPLSPAAAAKIAGVSRSLISKEIKSGALPATLRNNGHHAIERADLDLWMSRRTDRAKAPEPPVTRHETINETLDRELVMMREAVARLEGQAEVTAARLADLAADRDAWKEQAQRLASEPRSAASVSLWSRIFKPR